MSKSCGWPFHNDPHCEECETWEEEHGAAMDKYLEELAARRKDTRTRKAQPAVRKSTNG